MVRCIGYIPPSRRGGRGAGGAGAGGRRAPCAPPPAPGRSSGASGWRPAPCGPAAACPGSTPSGSAARWSRSPGRPGAARASRRQRAAGRALMRARARARRPALPGKRTAAPRARTPDGSTGPAVTEGRDPRQSAAQRGGLRRNSTGLHAPHQEILLRHKAKASSGIWHPRRPGAAGRCLSSGRRAARPRTSYRDRVG